MSKVSIEKTKKKGRGLLANKNFKRGEHIVPFRGKIVSKAIRYSLQIGWNKHIDPLPPARFLNHSCNPNAGIKTDKNGNPFLCAMRKIKRGEEITFDYAMSEYEIVPKMRCRCQSKNCRKFVGGFKYLDERTKKKYKGFVLPYLFKTLLVATTNPGKFEEYQLIFKNFLPKFRIVSLRDLKIKKKVKESGKTFQENAAKKARFYCRESGLPSLGDDAGVEIDFLGGGPGVKSRRWPGYEASDEELINFTLEKLKGVPQSKRGAQLRAIVALAFPGDKKVHPFEGILRGRIAEKPIKKRFKGYPFRAIFIPAGGNKYLGEMSIIAHRKQAIEKALPIIIKKLSED